MEADWCNLPIDLWSIIGHKLDVGVDRIRFRSVSNSLRSSLSFPQPPWLVLSESDQVGLEPHEYLSEEEEELGDDDEVVVPEVQEEELVVREVEVGYEQRQDKGINRNDELMVMDQEVKNAIPIPHRGIVDIGSGGSEQQIFDFDLPEAHRKRFIGSTGTWLITADTHKAIHLLNLFSKLQVELPSMSTFNCDERITTPKDYRDMFITKAIISAPPTSQDCVAMALYLGSRLAIAKLGDTSWINVETPLPNIVDMIFYNERFYVVNYRGAVMVCDISDNLHSPTASVLMDQSQFQKLGIELTTAENFYLVEWMGELLLVIRFLDITEVYNMYEAEEKTYIKSEDKPWYITYNFKVYTLDSSNRKWEELKSLGDYSLFLGMNASTSMLASDCVGRVKKNCIYFTDDSFCFSETKSAGGHDMGVFDMENNIIQTHYHGVSTSEFSPPIWVIPTILAKKSVTKLHMKKPSTIAPLEYSSFGPKNTYCAQHDTDH